MKTEEKKPKPEAQSLNLEKKAFRSRFAVFSSKQFWVRTILILAASVFLLSTTFYGVALWYQHTQKGKPYQLGVTFIPSYAEYLGVDPHKTLEAITSDLGVRQFRLVSYWNKIEVSPGMYDFSELDWQFEAVEKAGGTVSLAVGLRQPRWPECHAPSFYDTKKPRHNWQKQLEAFMTAVVNRYKTSPALDSYQLENEFFNHFGECYNFDRQRLVEEKTLLNKLDSKHPVIISRSNNYAGFALREPLGDINGISLYRRVWDGTLTKRYQTYPFPSWHYAALAGSQKILTSQDSVIHELQAEPWPPNGKNITDISLAEQNKTFDADRFIGTLKFAKQTGIRRIDLWGAEYWYYRWKVLGDDSVWREAREAFDR
ncbi:beta-galactosidase [Candidatus Saccharibacteria bacterium]|nr:MAG: beta-galactosidase [Candidatus Saccharibacteria bacterium]